MPPAVGAQNLSIAQMPYAMTRVAKDVANRHFVNDLIPGASADVGNVIPLSFAVMVEHEPCSTYTIWGMQAAILTPDTTLPFIECVALLCR